MNQQVDSADIILFLTSFKINNDDIEIINKFKTKKIIWIISKIDLVDDKSLLYKLVDDLSKKYEFIEIFPVNLLNSDYKNSLLTLLKNIYLLMTMSLLKKSILMHLIKKSQLKLLEVKYLDFVIMSYLTFLKLK